MASLLVRVARSVLDAVLGKMQKQPHELQTVALAPLRQIVQRVVGGAWVGMGADAFVEELSNLLIPGIGQVSDQIVTLTNDLNNARDMIERADEEGEHLVIARLYDAFNFY